MSRHVQMDEKPVETFNEHHGGDGMSTLAPTGTRATEEEKGSGYEPSIAGLQSSEYKKRERRLVRKLDLCIMPFAVLLYLSAYLDRGNLGNAKLLGLFDTVLDNNDTAYAMAVNCFFITYIVFSIPGTLMAKAINPSWSIAAGALIWSIAATSQAGASNPAGLYVSRLFVGIGESMFGQAMAFHLSLWYTKKDLAKRVGLFISAGALSGAFGGLISYGVASIKNTSIAQWRILFLIEGCPSVLLAVAVALFMPSRPEKSRLLSEDERTLCLTRLNRQSSDEAYSGIDWNGVKRCLTDWKTYVISISYSCMNMTLSSVSSFLPTIVKGLGGKTGYTTAQAQLFTVPPYAAALVFMLLLTAFSDRTQARGIPIMSVFLIGVLGWSILLGIPAAGITASQYSARYFGVVCVVAAGYTNIPLIISWQAGNTGQESQRATSLGMLNTLGQCLSLAASFLFPSNEGLQYTKGCAINIAFQCLGFLIALSMTMYYRYENRRRDKVEGGRPPLGTPLETMEKFDLAPGFRYTP